MPGARRRLLRGGQGGQRLGRDRRDRRLRGRRRAARRRAQLVPADVIVTATGLRLALGGKIAVCARRRARRFQPSAGSTAGACSRTCPTSRWCSATSTPAGRCAPTTTPTTSAGCSTTMAGRGADVVDAAPARGSRPRRSRADPVLLGLPPARPPADPEKRGRRCPGGSTRTTSRTAATSASARSTTACCASNARGARARTGLTPRPCPLTTASGPPRSS